MTHATLKDDPCHMVAVNKAAMRSWKFRVGRFGFGMIYDQTTIQAFENDRALDAELGFQPSRRRGRDLEYGHGLSFRSA
jgi:hypothetical protein